MIPESHLTDEQRELYDAMSDISEDCHCAGWITGNEYNLWAALQDGDLRYGQGEIDAEQLELVRGLSKEVDGWIIWLDDDDVPGLPVEQWGARFVTMAEWLDLIGAKAAARKRVAEVG